MTGLGKNYDGLNPAKLKKGILFVKNKCMSFVLSLLLIFSLFTPAYAADTADTASITITLPDSVQKMQKSATSGYVFDAYQIFTGTVNNSDPKNPVISNVQWGSGLTDKGQAALLSALGIPGASAQEASVKLSNIDNAQAEQISAALLHDLNDSSGSATTPNDKGDYVIAGLLPGYYLIDNTSVPENVVGTSPILSVLGNATVRSKLWSTNIPTLKKKVQDPESKEYKNITSYPAGSTITYKLDATIAQNYENFKSYPVTITDLLPPDVSVVPWSVKISTPAGTISTDDYQVDATQVQDGHQVVEIHFYDLKDVTRVNDKNLTITITYQATMEPGAKDTLINTAAMTYNDDINTDHQGTTPSVSTTVVNFGLNISKVDQDKNALKGAGFALYRVDGEKETLVQELDTASTAPNIFNFKGLAPGEYKLVETVTPAGYNTVDPITFTVEATYDQSLQTVKSLSATSSAIELTPDDTNTALSTSVVNTSGVTLPKTGSITSLMMLLVGAGIMALAGYGIYHYRKEA